MSEARTLRIAHLRRRPWTVGLAAVGLACGGGSPTDPGGDPGGGVVAPFEITLLAPVAGATLAQNVSTNGCTAHPQSGYGLQLSFDWSDAGHASGIQRYEIVVQHPLALIPLVDATSSISSHVYTACNAFVTDSWLDGWTWKVRAVAKNAEVSLWSEVRGFSFAPCQLSGGAYCTP